MSRSRSNTKVGEEARRLRAGPFAASGAARGRPDRLRLRWPRPGRRHRPPPRCPRSPGSGAAPSPPCAARRRQTTRSGSQRPQRYQRQFPFIRQGTAALGLPSVASNWSASRANPDRELGRDVRAGGAQRLLKDRHRFGGIGRRRQPVLGRLPVSSRSVRTASRALRGLPRPSC